LRLRPHHRHLAFTVLANCAVSVVRRLGQRPGGRFGWVTLSPSRDDTTWDWAWLRCRGCRGAVWDNVLRRKECPGMGDRRFGMGEPNAVVRVLTRTGDVTGAGIVVGQGLVATCAHVVAAAAGHDPEAAQPPSESVVVDFPLAGGVRIVTEVR